MLDKLAHLEGHAAQRARVSRPKILPLRGMAAEHKLSSFETELIGLAPENWSMSYERFPEDIVVVLPI